MSLGETVVSTIKLSTDEILAIGCEAFTNEPTCKPVKFSIVPEMGASTT